MPEWMVWLVPLSILAVVAYRGFRPYGRRELEAWAQRYRIRLTPVSEPAAVSYLQRARRMRTAGGLLGAVFPVVYTLAADRSAPGGYLTLLGGYLLGAALAEITFKRPATSAGRSAALTPRELPAYLPSGAITAMRALAGVGVGLFILYLLTPTRESGAGSGGLDYMLGSAIGGVVFAALIEGFQRWLVGRSQPVVSRDLLEADDAIRSSSVHALSGSGLAVLFILVSNQLFLLGAASELQLIRWCAPIISLVSLGIAVGCWLHLGHAEAWRVRRTYPQGSPT